MLVKEYRIPLPLTVDEYRIAQLYMIAKKSRLASTGVGSGVEILVNEPYTDGPGGSGQYTHKLYHIGSHLPGWLKSLLPRSALTVEEEAWNAYPYTKTRYKCPFVERFVMELETRYFNDNGFQDNVFGLSSKELQEREVDFIDIVKDQLASSDYIQEEDPRYYISKTTGRGPLSENWIEEYWNACRGKKTPLADGKAIMCAYKLCRVEFRYWGMQSKIERFIHDIALRKTMVPAHKQAWSWQDEWYGKTIEEIRLFEQETQEILASKMAGANEGDSPQSPDKEFPPPIPEAKETLSLGMHSSQKQESVSALTTGTTMNDGRQKNYSRGGAASIDKSLSSTSAARSNLDIQQRVCAQMESIAQDSDGPDSSDEFYDASEEFSETRSLTKWSSMELIPEDEEDSPRIQDVFDTGQPSKVTSELRLTVGQGLQEREHSSCPTSVLFFVFHGASVLDANQELSTKTSDVVTFRGAFESVVRQYYPSLLGRVAHRLVPCPPICAEALAVFTSLSPYSFDAYPSQGDGGFPVTHDSVPIGAIPLFAITSPDYWDSVSKTITLANQVYQDFLKSEEGVGFNGHISIIGDSVGSLLAYDALCAGFGGTGTGSSEHLGPDPSSSPAGKSPLIAVGNEAPKVDSLSLPKRNAQKSLSDVIVGNQDHPLGHPPVKAQLSAPTPRRTSSISSTDSQLGRLDFEVTDFFLFGSPLAGVLAYRKMQFSEDRTCPPQRPAVQQVYNMFHAINPLAGRLEPLLSTRFAFIPPVSVPRYQKHPLGDGFSYHLLDCIQGNLALFRETEGSPVAPVTHRRRISELTCSHHPASSAPEPPIPISTVTKLTGKWWGLKRLDYALYCPEGLANFPPHSLPHLLHASYWESQDVIAFIIRQVLQTAAGLASPDEKDVQGFCPSQPREKWRRKRTSVKLRNMSANHRANDVIVGEGMPQVISARFMYGPLDMVALSGEKVDLYCMTDPKTGEWVLLDTLTTDKTGRVTYTISPLKALTFGIYPVKMVVRGDHTGMDFHLAVIPPKTECVVFSIDGSFTASVSVTGRDPKVRPGAVDVVRHWQEMGYLIVYVTARPDMQQRFVISWLAQHNFPHGMVSFADGLSTDFLAHKVHYLKHLIQEVGVVIHCAYGSSKDIGVYASLGLEPSQIYIVGKTSRKHYSSAIVLMEGYAAHLSELTAPGGSRPARGNARMVIPRGFFSLPGQGVTLQRRLSSKKASMSSGRGSSRGKKLTPF